jgi:hypothetical protein
MLLVISIDEDKKWDELVKSFTNYDIYYLSSYTKAFKLHGDGEPLLIYYEDNNMKAINVVMKRDIGKDVHFSSRLPENSIFDLTTPYGYGGFLTEGDVVGDSLHRLDNEYCAYCECNGIISEFVRFHPITNNSKCLEELYDISTLGKTISINLFSESQIWDDLTSKNRNMIRKAQKSGVEIFWGRSAELYKEFIRLYNDTMDKDNAKDYYYFGTDFYDSILNDLNHNALIFYAEYQEKIISMSIIMFANQQIHYHLSASDRMYLNLAPTNLLLYEVACWGCANNYKSFHLGGGLGSKEDSLYKFKKAFNRNNDNIFAIGRKIFNEKIYNELTLIRKEDVGFDLYNLFFPLYRA